MKIPFTFIVILCLSLCCCLNGQQPAYYFDLAVKVLSSNGSVDIITKRLDSLKSTLISSRSSCSKKFNRSIDCDYKHLRIDLELNFNRFQIDILHSDDTIFASSVIQFVNPFDFDNTKTANFNDVDTINILRYLRNRNKLYSSSKSIADLMKEVCKNEFYAFYCGYGLQKTRQGKYIENLVKRGDTTELVKLLQDICVETQAYGVAGFSMLAKNGYTHTTVIQTMIQKIRRRNSETVICSGCLMGLVENIYSKKSLASH